MLKKIKAFLKKLRPLTSLTKRLDNLLLAEVIKNSVKSVEDRATLLLLLLYKRKVVIDNTFATFSNIQKLLSAVRPVKIDTLVRIGGKHDGGYVMATPPPPYEEPAKAISLGVSEYSPWDLEMAQKGYKVIQYDGSIVKEPDKHPNISFHKKFVGIKDNHNTISFNKVIQDNNLQSHLHNILQVDIENAEWDILEQVDMSLITKYFSQIIFEFHQLDPREYQQTQRQIAIFKKLSKDYAIIHSHFNNYGGTIYSRELFWGFTIELSFLRKDLIPKGSELRKNCDDLEHLDYPNAIGNPEIPLRFE